MAVSLLVSGRLSNSTTQWFLVYDLSLDPLCRMQKSLEKCKDSNMGIRKKLQKYAILVVICLVFWGILGRCWDEVPAKNPRFQRKTHDTMTRSTGEEDGTGAFWLWASQHTVQRGNYHDGWNSIWWDDFFSPAMTDPLLYGIPTYYIL